MPTSEASSGTVDPSGETSNLYIDQMRFQETALERIQQDHNEITIVRWLPLAGAYESRRKAASAIRAGRVAINGEPCTQASYRVRADQDVVTCDGNVVDAPHTIGTSRKFVKHTHVVLNKPPGTLCTRNDRRQIKGGGRVKDVRPTVYGLVSEQLHHSQHQPRCVPIGRLDVDTTGLLILTSDGLLNNALANPAYKVDKVYRATLRDTSQPLSDDAIKQLADGIFMQPGKGKPAVRVKGEAKNVPGQVGVVDLCIWGGYNHQVKHMFRLVGRPLRALHRLKFANLEIDSRLLEGQCRYLTDVEVKKLYDLAKERLKQAEQSNGKNAGEQVVNEQRNSEGRQE